MFVTILLIPFKANAKEMETLGDLRQAYEEKLAEKRAYDNKSAAAKKEIENKKAQSAKAEQDLSAAVIAQDEAQKKIDESNVHIEELTGESKKILLYMQQMQDSNAYVEYVTGATSMTEMIQRMEAVKQINDYVDTTMKALEKEITDNETLKAELEIKKENLNKQIQVYKETIAKLYTQAEEYDAFADDIDTQVQAAKKNYEANKQTCKENIGKTDDSVKLSDCSKVPVNAGWLRPLKSGVITSTIGSRWGSYHNALDIGGNSEGTPIYAPAAGTIGAINYRTSCGGNRVYLLVTVGGKQYTAYFYHLLEVYVKTGQVVDQNTVLGTVGGGSTATSKGGYDSCTFGAHLHYGVAYGWKPYHVTGNNNLMVPPPGFTNSTGYRFYSRII